MRKISLLFASAILIAGGTFLQSCEKCTTCKFVYVVAGETRTYSYGEVCGNNEDINDIEDLCAQESLAVNGDCQCD